MTNLQKKALEQVRNTLNSCDSFPLYTFVLAKLQEMNKNTDLNPEALQAISREFQKISESENKKVQIAKEWIEVLINED